MNYTKMLKRGCPKDNIWLYFLQVTIDYKLYAKCKNRLNVITSYK